MAIHHTAVVPTWLGLLLLAETTTQYLVPAVSATPAPAKLALAKAQGAAAFGSPDTHFANLAPASPGYESWMPVRKFKHGKWKMKCLDRLEVQTSGRRKSSVWGEAWLRLELASHFQSVANLVTPNSRSRLGACLARNRAVVKTFVVSEFVATIESPDQRAPAQRCIT